MQFININEALGFFNRDLLILYFYQRRKLVNGNMCFDLSILLNTLHCWIGAIKLARLDVSSRTPASQTKVNISVQGYPNKLQPLPNHYYRLLPCYFLPRVSFLRLSIKNSIKNKIWFWSFTNYLKKNPYWQRSFL